MNQFPFEKIKRKEIIIRKAETDKNLGKRPEERTIEELIQYGIINLNKNSGPTSHQQVDYVKRILNIKKSGHSGTLDPHVTGVLPIALDKATRIVQVLLKAGKEYVALMHLHKEIPEEKIRETFKKIIGKIKQIPPKRSAVKRVERTREVYYVDIIEIDGKDVLFRIGCEAGTYIRKIISDFGKELNCGAHMQELIRTKVSIFTDKNWCSLIDLKDAYEFYKDRDDKLIRKYILPFEKAVEHLPKVWIMDNAVDNICHGADIYVVGLTKIHSEINKGDLVAVMTLKDELICIGEAVMNTDEMRTTKKGTAIKIKKVFMERGTYKNI